MRFVGGVFLGLIIWSACADVDAQSLTPDESSPQVGILVFSAYSCSYCAQTARMLDQLQQQYPQHLSIQIKHFPLTLEPEELWAHRAAFALGEQGKLTQSHAQLFEVVHKPSSIKNFSSGLSAQGVDLKRYDVDLASTASDRAIANDRSEAIALGVRVTPTVFIDGYKLEGLQQLSVYEALIRFRLAQPNEPAAQAIPMPLSSASNAFGSAQPETAK